jgi:hypothetical protein
MYIKPNEVLAAIVITIVTISCSNQPHAATVEAFSAATTGSCLPDSTSDRDQLITLDEATDLIYNFSAANSSFATTKGICADLSRKELCNLATSSCIGPNCGLLIYFCYDSIAKFAYKEVFDLDTNQSIIPITATSDLNLTESTTHLSMEQILNKDSVKSAIRNVSQICNFTNPIVSYTEVNAMNAVFLQEINTKMPVGFFNFHELNQVLEQMDSDSSKSCIGIRLYFGYDSTADNKVRVVAFGIRKDGYNCTDTSAKILERSWPPRN